MKILLSLLLLSISVQAGLPPTTSKVNGESTYPTTFKTDFGTFTGTRSGTTLTLTGIGAATGASLVLGGTLDPDAILDLQSTTKALLPPRMTTAQKVAIPTPTEGSLLYDNTIKAPSYFDGVAWIPLSGKILAHVDTVEGTTTSVVSYGSTDTSVLDFIPTKIVDGNCGTASRTAATGFYYTFSRKCILNITTDVTLAAPVGNIGLAITRNSANLTTGYTNGISYVINTLNGYIFTASANIIGESGDVIRVQTSGGFSPFVDRFSMIAVGYDSVSVDNFSVSMGGTDIVTICTASPCFISQIGSNVTSITRSSTGNYDINFSKTYSKVNCVGYAALLAINQGPYISPVKGENVSSVSFTINRVDTAGPVDNYATFVCQGSY